MVRPTPSQGLLGSTLLVAMLAWPVCALAEEVAPAAPLGPDSAPRFQDNADLLRRLEQVDERSRILERKLELQDEAAAKTVEAPSLTASDKGFALKSANGAFVLKLRGLVQADARAYLGDDSLGNSDTFLIRRARPILEASFYDVADFRITPDFGNGQGLQDAYGDLRPVPWLKLRVGKFRPPVGLERLQSAAAVIFVERATPTSLVPNRDVGAQLHGDIADGVVSYALGLFNGVLDGGSSDIDTGFAKDVIARVFVRPLKSDPHSLLSGLGFGVGASTGNRSGKAAVLTSSGSTTTVSTASTPNLSSYKSAGQQTIFSYISNDKVEDGTILAEGRHTRLAPQGYYYTGPFGVMAEYVRSTHRVLKGAQSATLNHTAWQVATTYLIGEGTNAYEGIQVRNPFNPKQGTLGVLELAARYNELRLDDATFPLWADVKKSVRRARGFAVAANWHWSRNVKLATTYEETHFDGGAATGDRNIERVLFWRLQTAF